VPEAAGLAVLVVAALAASIVGGVAGFGGGLILLPVVTWIACSAVAEYLATARRMLVTFGLGFWAPRVG
jgi:uncharacterized membrane protein YfcA